MDPASVNPVPFTAAEFTVTEAVPVDDRVTDCVAAEFTETLPNATVVALMLRVATVAAGGFNFRLTVLETLLALAVTVTVCADVTEETVALNAALVAFAGTVTEDGTATELLLLDRATAMPLLGAAAVSATVQLSDPAPVIDVLPQERELSAAAGAAAVPVPLRETTAELLVEEVLAMVSEPEMAPAAVGLN